jgi:hypothetical protein|tara:strand:- start:96 stop:368 length:273 start_codon:yes stop_codon:yes gene_type:complete
MSTKIIEHNEMIAKRVPPGDRWTLIGDPKKEVFKSLTDALEAFFHQTGFKGAYRLDPLDSKLYAIQTQEEEIKKEEPKMYSLYGEFKQGV